MQRAFNYNTRQHKSKVPQQTIAISNSTYIYGSYGIVRIHRCLTTAHDITKQIILKRAVRFSTINVFFFSLDTTNWELQVQRIRHSNIK